MKKILIAFMMFGFLSSAQALHFSVGVDLGVSGDDGTDDLDSTPMIADIELGGSTLGFSYGVAYEMSLTDLEFENSTSEWGYNAYGLFVGYDFPIMFRLYGAYMLGGTSENQNDFKLKKMSGTKLGVAYTGFPLIDITLEMRAYEFDEDGNGNTLTNAEFNLTSIGLAYSF